MYGKLAVLNWEIPADKSVKNCLLCFLPVKRRIWFSLFVTMRLAIFRLGCRPYTTLCWQDQVMFIGHRAEQSGSAIGRKSGPS